MGLLDNTVSLLFSQPITALQILTKENEWKWVKHVPDGAVVNVADALECRSKQSANGDCRPDPKSSP